MPPNVHSFAAGQGGHVTREQLLAAGLNPRTIKRQVQGGKLIRVYRGVYAVGHRPRNPADGAHAALLAAGPRSALAGSCALVLWGVWRHWPRQLELVTVGDRRPSGLKSSEQIVPRLTGPPQTMQASLHQSATLLRRDIRLAQGLRVTSPARTMLDAAERLTVTQRSRAINDLRLRDLLSLEELADVVDRNPTHRGVTLLRPELELAQPEPTRSVLEDRFLPLLLRHGLPTPQINVHVCGHRVDAYFERERLIVELDGWKTHRTKRRFLEDRQRDFEILAETGIPTVRLPYEDVSDEAIARLGQLIGSRRAC
jgi:Transcriptional regulator, AbiEi antitoxin